MLFTQFVLYHGDLSLALAPLMPSPVQDDGLKKRVLPACFVQDDDSIRCEALLISLISLIPPISLIPLIPPISLTPLSLYSKKYFHGA